MDGAREVRQTPLKRFLGEVFRYTGVPAQPWLLPAATVHRGDHSVEEMTIGAGGFITN